VPPLPDKPSLAVMPFQNMSGDPEQEYFADGMVEEIITALSRIRWLFVIARNSSFSYDVSLGLIDRCLTLNPSCARGWHWSALLRLFAGQPDLALEHFENYLRLSPRDRMATYLNGIGEAHFFNRRFDEAAANLLASLEGQAVDLKQVGRELGVRYAAATRVTGAVKR
jgi:TolB-like protein